MSEMVPLNSGSESDGDDSTAESSSIVSVQSTSTPPPTKQEIRKIYNTLMDQLQELSTEDGLGADVETKIKESLKTSQRIFNNFGGGLREMHLGCLHAKKMAEIIRLKTENIGASTSGFAVDSFLRALKANNHQKMGTVQGKYSVAELDANVWKASTNCAFTVPTFSSLFGTFDRESISTPVPAKVKKPRAAPRRKQFDETNPTKHTDVSVKDLERQKKDNSATKLSMELLHILNIYKLQYHKPLGLYNFTMDKNSLSKTIKYIFYLGFLIRGGHVSLNREGTSNLVVEPADPPAQDEVVERRQYIFSLSPTQWKALADASQGQNIITDYKVAHSKPSTSTSKSVLTPRPSSITRRK